MTPCPKCGTENAEKARFCQKCGSPLTAAESAVPVEVPKVVTAIFCDLKGSTALGETIDPETLRRVIARYFGDMKDVIERHGGGVQKFIGDAVVGAFGVPVMHEDDSLRAVRAAEGMQAAMEKMNDDLEVEFGVRLAARIGVSTGEVIVGRSEEGGFISGEAVEAANVMEKNSIPGFVLISESTYRLVRDAVKVEKRELEGEYEGLVGYQLAEVIPLALGASRRLDSPLVAREKELAFLNDLFEEALAGNSKTAAVFGNAGSGKSRLTAEFLKGAEGRARIVSGRCLSYGEGVTFWPLSEALRKLASINEDDSGPDAVDKLAALLPDTPGGRAIADRIAGGLGWGPHAGDTQETFWAVRKLFEYLASKGPLVIVFDDIHWAEPTMLELIEYLATFLQGLPTFLLSISRRELLDTRPSIGTSWPSLFLEPLGEEAVTTLIENLLGRARLPETARRLIVQAAEGNPLYVEEILRMLIDDGRLHQVDGHWEPVGSLDDVAVPPTISALIAARLDRLSPNEQGVVQRGAVVGTEFWWGAITDLSPESMHPHLGGDLQMLVRKELIRPHTSTFIGEDAFRFGHILIRDSAYQGVPKQLRAELHEKFTGWLQAKAGDRIGEYEEILGYHLEQAFKLNEELGNVDEKARALGARGAELLGSAGGRALARADFPAAANMLGRAITLLPAADPLRMQLSFDLIDALMQVGDSERAKRVVANALRIADRLKLEQHQARFQLQELRLQIETEADDDWSEPALAKATALIDTLTPFGDDQGLAKAHVVRAEVFWEKLHHAETDEALEHALEHARKAGRKHDEALIVGWLATSQFFGPTPAAEAFARCEQLLAENDGHQKVRAACSLVMGGLTAMQGDPEAGRQLLTQARAIYSDLGDVRAMATSTQAAGMLELFAGEPESALDWLEQGMDEFKRMGYLSYIPTSAGLAAEAAYLLRRFDRAFELTETSESNGGELTEWGPTRAKVLARRGEVEEGVRVARDAAVETAETDDLRARGDTMMALAETLYLADLKDDAALFVEKALAMYRAKGIAPYVKKGEALLAGISKK